MQRSFRRPAILLASWGALLIAVSVSAQAQVTPPVPATRSGPGGSANPVLPNSAAQSPATQRQTVVGAPLPSTAIHATPLPEAVAAPVAQVDVDRVIAGWIAAEHRVEVAFGNQAKDKSLSSRAKLLATLIVDDHNSALADLSALYPDALNPADTVRTTAVVQPVMPAQPARPDSTVPPTSTIRPALPLADRPASVDVVVPVVAVIPTSLDLKRRIDNQTLTLVHRKLGDKQGVDFDAAYVAMMVVKQQELYATLHAVRDLASAPLRKLIDAQLQTVQRHIGMAEQLMPEVATRAFIARTPGVAPR